MADPIVDGASQVATPVASMGFGAREQADETRQSSHGVLNDAQLDVNMNSIVAREQALTFTSAGQMFTSNNDTRQKLQDQFLARNGLK